MKSLFGLLLISVAVVLAQDGRLWRDNCVDQHNYYRKQKNKPLLKWDNFAAHYARKRVEYLKETCTFNVSSTLPYGENLRGANTKSCANVVKGWWNGTHSYDPLNPTANDQGMAYAQLMWKTTTMIGCAYSKHCEYPFIVICYYYPPGNLRGSTKNRTIELYREHV